jgi:transposase-like protein
MGSVEAPHAVRGAKMNPIWTQMIYEAVKDAMKVCPHCKRADAYALKRPGQFYKCKHCGHRFKERGR